MLDTIQRRFLVNLDRVNGLVGIYDSLGEGKGRKPVEVADLLCAAVVLLHATTEDVLRSLAMWKIPHQDATALAEIPLKGLGRKTKFVLSDLLQHRGRGVDEVIAESVRAFYEESNFNNIGDVKDLLGKIGIGPDLVAPFASDLASLMARRHWIVHRADQNPSSGSGHHAARSIGLHIVQNWIDVVKRFAESVLSAS